MNDTETLPPLLANECLGPEEVASLRALGYDVDEVWNWVALGHGREDPDVLAIGRRLGRVVVTYDTKGRSFDEGGDPGAGLVICRYAPEPPRVGAYVDVSLRAVGLDTVPGSHLVIEPGRVRVINPTRAEITVRNL